MKKHSIGTLVALTATVLLSGCALYFGDEKNGGDNWNYCGSDGYYSCDGDNCQWVGSTCPEPGQGSAGQPGEFECRDDADCAAGCYCGEAGVCEEAGFCTQDSDCGEGYECNEERSSCEPVSCTCVTDAEATAAGYDWCDETTQTCETGTDPEGTCAGEATCNIAMPVCPAGQVPTIGADGCWTTLCSPVAACEAAPACSHINDEANCLARWNLGTGDCAPRNNGINCTKPDGTACQSGDMNCSCETLVFASCRDNTSP